MTISQQETFGLLIASKAMLIKKALGAVNLTFKVHGDSVDFPWFSRKLPPIAAKAYEMFFFCLCCSAQEKDLVIPEEALPINEKKDFDKFLDFIGMNDHPGFPYARAVLLCDLEEHQTALFSNNYRRIFKQKWRLQKDCTSNNRFMQTVYRIVNHLKEPALPFGYYADEYVFKDLERSVFFIDTKREIRKKQNQIVRSSKQGF